MQKRVELHSLLISNMLINLIYTYTYSLIKYVCMPAFAEFYFVIIITSIFNCDQSAEATNQI